MDDLSTKIDLYCPTCGCTEFKFETPEHGQDYTDDWPFTCAHCGRTFTYARLIQSNQESINAAVDEMANNVLNSISMDLQEEFKKHGWDVK
jgi:uncharacterized Zn finger protein